MKLNELIEKFIENSLKTSELYEKNDYPEATKYFERSLEYYVQIISTKEGLEAFENLLDYDNKVLAFDVACFILNGGSNERALNLVKKLLKQKDKLGESAKGYYQRYISNEIPKKYWEQGLKEARERILKKDNAKEENVEMDVSNSSVVDFELPIFPNPKAEAINKFMKQHGEVQTIKDTNPIDEHLSIDINICKFKSGNDYVVYTTGMSNFRMDVPKTLFGKYNKFRYSEVLAFIPKSWGDDFESNNWKSFMTMLRNIAVYPHINGTWVGAGHTLEMDLSAFNDEFHSVVLCGLNMVDKNGNKLIVDKDVINIYVVVPIYKEELDYIHTYGYDNWENQKLFVQENPFLFTSERKSTLR